MIHCLFLFVLNIVRWIFNHLGFCLCLIFEIMLSSISCMRTVCYGLCPTIPKYNFSTNWRNIQYNLYQGFPTWGTRTSVGTKGFIRGTPFSTEVSPSIPRSTLIQKKCVKVIFYRHCSYLCDPFTEVFIYFPG